MGEGSEKVKEKRKEISGKYKKIKRREKGNNKRYLL